MEILLDAKGGGDVLVCVEHNGIVADIEEICSGEAANRAGQKSEMILIRMADNGIKMLIDVEGAN